MLTLISLLAAIFYLFPVVAEYERERLRKEGETRGVQTQRADNPAVEDYRQTYMRDYRRGGLPD